MILNISRERNGRSPATRIFEAAGAGACVITDEWAGLSDFLEPGAEVLIAADGTAVAELLAQISPEQARAIGQRARHRVLCAHTYSHRALQLEMLLEGVDRSRATGTR